ncbi:MULTISPECIES: FHA domain-containing protein [unclassified Brenneria]|uniref:FHA domain-containing protein n=1 Tax=unclassified Brenneria TaxID=2634434 RepID=UPI0029C254F1|nr:MULTISPECIES: FHA domain-containing protein [unclassified Brenneria]MDX5626661.1 FHA domain-containing protein [Brenneria sp. L3-3Z]MDX5693989.1 FHA domain-containing protein [Brenneria sp. L4-2C]MEE3661370.1 FHA domain-containing protein [Brenneria sp. g21c3]
MFELRVLTGLHRGAALPLSGSAWRIGADDDADLTLYDPGISARHALLEKQENGWLLSALDGDLCDTEGHSVTQIPDLTPGTPFALHHIWLCVVAADTPWDSEETERPDAGSPAGQDDIPPPTQEQQPVAAAAATVAPARLPLWAKSCYLLLSLLLATMVGGWLLQESVAMPPAPPPQDTRRQLNTMTQLEHTLRTLLRERELTDAVKLASTHTLVTLTGQLTPQEQKKLERMLIQFHQRYNTALTVDNRTQIKSAQLPFQIVQVTSGPRANVVTADGRRLFVGDEVEQLRLVSIDDHQIVFGGQQQIKVNW